MSVKETDIIFTTGNLCMNTFRFSINLHKLFKTERDNWRILNDDKKTSFMLSLVYYNNLLPTVKVINVVLIMIKQMSCKCINKYLKNSSKFKSFREYTHL